MKTIRIDEPHDPGLRMISQVIPDDWIDQQWPAKSSFHQRRLKGYRTSQFVRLHLLLLIKRLHSFNELCEELRHNRDMRRFCRLPLRDPAPVAATLSKWRRQFGFFGWQKLHAHLVRLVVKVYPTPVVGVLVVDTTDLPAAVRRTWKKKTTRPMPTECAKPDPAEGAVRQRAANPITLSATKNIRWRALSLSKAVAVPFP